MGYRVGHGLNSNKGPLKWCGEMDPLASLTIVRRHRICDDGLQVIYYRMLQKSYSGELELLAEILASTSYITEYDTVTADT